MIIMPSVPRLRTPERSTTNSPDAASNSGVEAAMTDRMMASGSMDGLPDRAQDADAVDGERIASQHVEQQDALEHLGEVERTLHRNWRALTADEGERKKKTGDQDTDGIKTSQKGDDDGCEAVARRHARIEMTDRSRHFDDPRNPCKRTGNRESEEHQAIGIEAGEARGARGGADDPAFEASDRRAEQHRPEHDDDEREDRAGVQATDPLEQSRNRGGRIE